MLKYNASITEGEEKVGLKTFKLEKIYIITPRFIS